MPPDLSTIIQNTFRAMVAEMNTSLPGEIVSYDFKKRQPSIKPLIKKKFLNDDTLALPIINNVPVIFPGTSKIGMHFPLRKKDSVLIVFSQRSLDKWLESGKDVDPQDTRKFDLTDAVAIPGLNSFNKSNFATNNEDIVIANNKEKITLKANGDIEMGADSLKKLINDAFKSQFDSHVHNVLTVGTPAAQGGVTSSPTVLAGLNPILVPPVGIPIPTNLAGDAIPASSITSKVKAK